MAHSFIRWSLISISIITIIAIIVIPSNMPNYGINNRLKNLLLQILLTNDVPKISVEHALKRHSSAIFLDTRSKEEFEVSHIDSAVHVGFKEFDLSSVRTIPKEQEIIVYCSVGKRSDEVSKKLISAGYTNLHNLYGGIFEWFNEGNKIVAKDGKPTNTIHGYNRLFGWWVSRGKKVYS